ncbi:MAG: hypothetical protein VYA34_12805 [Myxococcota bacterium]|nr:hypothetical protein [Myxococcota bacterium]
MGRVKDKHPEKTSSGDAPVQSSIIHILVGGDQPDIPMLLSQCFESIGYGLRSIGAPRIDTSPTRDNKDSKPSLNGKTSYI